MQSQSDAGIPALALQPSPFLAAPLSHLEKERIHLADKVPEWADVEMERLYQSIFASAVLVRVSGQTHEVSTYINRKAGQTAAVLLFKTEDRRVRILNELIPLDPDEIRDFVEYAFTTMPDIRSITFSAIRTGALDLPYPYQRHNQTEDIIIELPATFGKYHDSLGKNLRKTIRRYSERIEQDFPSFEYVVVDGRDVHEEHILKLVEFNRTRMSGKNKVSGVDEAQTRWLLDCVRQFDGMVVFAVVDGKICAGQACCRVGGHFFMLIVGHDPAWDDYRLGTLCQYRAIREMIERGGKACHFLWGREEYKYRFLGLQHDFDKIVVYPSQVGMLREAKRAALLMVQGKMRQARLWVLDPENQDKLLPKLANRVRQARIKGTIPGYRLLKSHR